MPNIPAYCAKCDIYFESPYFVGTGFDGEIFFEDNQLPCVKCGGSARVEGLVKVIGDAFAFIHAAKFDEKELNRLTEILRDAISNRKSATEIKESIAAEVPAASGLNKYFSDNTGLYSLVMMILAILQIAAPYIKQPGEQVDTQKIVEAVLKAQQKQQPPPPAPLPRRNSRVNEPCYCGSGRKAKKCHGVK